MKGSVIPRGKSTWRIKYEGPRGPNCERKQVMETVKGSKREAQRVLRERIAAVEGGTYVARNKERVAEFMYSWLEGYAVTHTRARTVQGYRGNITRYIIPCLGGVQLQSLTPRHIQDLHRWMLDRGLSAQTVVHAHRVLSEALNHGVQWGIIPRNPAVQVSPPRPERPDVEVPDTEIVRRFFAAAQDNPFLDAFKLAFYTGIRRSELTGLRWEGVDFATNTLRVTGTLQRVTGQGLVTGPPKTRTSRRAIALGKAAVDLLHFVRGKQLALQAELGDLFQNPQGYVFTDQLGKPIDPDRLTKEFHKVAQAAGLPAVNFHKLRHSHASLMLKAGVKPKEISERLGHSTIALTMDTYSHLLPGMGEAAALAFEQLLDDELSVPDYICPDAKHTLGTTNGTQMAPKSL